MIDELVDDLVRAYERISPPRQRTLHIAIQRLGASGILESRVVTTTGAAGPAAQLLVTRAAQTPPVLGRTTRTSEPAESEAQPMADVALR